ncbi:hypothetical protein HDU98_009456 [Podochytrium sp. JEL0797]|nr:hypothetical protein HDU98_009456 [Podochytrium sp. JEL0797]
MTSANSPKRSSQDPLLDEENQQQPLLRGSWTDQAQTASVESHKMQHHPSQSTLINDESFLHANGDYYVAGSSVSDVLGKRFEPTPYLEDEVHKPKSARKWERYVFCCVKKRRISSERQDSRFPETHVYSIDLSNLIGTNSSFEFSNTDNLNDLVIRMNLTMNVATKNPNRYGLYIDKIDLLARVAVNTSFVDNPLMTSALTSFRPLVAIVGPTPIPPAGYYAANDSVIGTARTNSGIYFPSQEWVNYTLNFEFSYTPDPVVGLLNDPTVLEIADVCRITSRYPKHRSMRIDYVATSTISALKALNYAPSLASFIRITCPFSETQITDTINYVQQGISVSDALKVVFGGVSLDSVNGGPSSA